MINFLRNAENLQNRIYLDGVLTKPPGAASIGRATIKRRRPLRPFPAREVPESA